MDIFTSKTGVKLLQSGAANGDLGPKYYRTQKMAQTGVSTWGGVGIVIFCCLTLATTINSARQAMK